MSPMMMERIASISFECDFGEGRSTLWLWRVRMWAMECEKDGIRNQNSNQTTNTVFFLESVFILSKILLKKAWEMLL